MNIERIDSGPASLDRVEYAYRQGKAEAEMQVEFMRAAAARDMDALCAWAPMTRVDGDWSKKRLQTTGEAMECSLGVGPSVYEVFRLLCDVAYSEDLASQPDKARALITRMARAFSTYYAEADHE